MQNRSNFVSLRGRSAAVAIFNRTKWHPGTKFGETERNSMRPTCAPSPCASRLVLPCFAAGCHAFDFKIATAAMRPRNDKKTGRLCEKTYQFLDRNVLSCPAGTPQRRFSRSAISRGRKPTFPVRRIFRLLNGQISLHSPASLSLFCARTCSAGAGIAAARRSSPRHRSAQRRSGSCARRCIPRRRADGSCGWPAWRGGWR